ncbi:Exodeoxyribonuclease X [hydrothermal vent metagenome]|uniref:Exodeoxyribonuclease X n=1 Tax=hydrothermal vent metagenome TaxID=652676 RepID=A0A1W1EKM6_9ZZZZ
MAKYILFDTETTGNQDDDRIIQVGALLIHSKDNIDKFDELCSSEVDIKIEAMEVHNITPDIIANSPKFIDTKFYKAVNEFNSSENFLIAHNINFDLGMLEKEGFKNSYTLIDTLRCAKHLLPDSPYHRLQYLRYSLGLFKNEQEEADKLGIRIKAHDAIGDVLVMKLLLSKLSKLAKEQYPNENIMGTLAHLTNTPVLMKTFKFGKYKDKNIEDIANSDNGYIKWMYQNLELDEDMKYTLEQYIY